MPQPGCDSLWTYTCSVSRAQTWQLWSKVGLHLLSFWYGNFNSSDLLAQITVILGTRHQGCSDGAHSGKIVLGETCFQVSPAITMAQSIKKGNSCLFRFCTNDRHVQSTSGESTLEMFDTKVGLFYHCFVWWLVRRRGAQSVYSCDYNTACRCQLDYTHTELQLIKNLSLKDPVSHIRVWVVYPSYTSCIGC